MAVQPLSPATDRRLGGPLPRQLANQTRGHLSAINLWQSNHAVQLHHAVLAAVSSCCPPLKGRFLTRYSPVRHCPRLPFDESPFLRFSFDLHVLGTPPAFVLSQDQTLYEWYLNLFPFPKKENKNRIKSFPKFASSLTQEFLTLAILHNLSFQCFHILTLTSF